jgi:hypothetical protein
MRLDVSQLNGVIGSDDGDRFATVAAGLESRVRPGTRIVVIMTSPGGNLDAGIKIGELPMSAYQRPLCQPRSRPLTGVAGHAGIVVPRVIAATGDQAARRFLENSSPPPSATKIRGRLITMP